MTYHFNIVTQKKYDQMGLKTLKKKNNFSKKKDERHCKEKQKTFADHVTRPKS